MTQVASILPTWAAILTSALLLLGAGLTLIGTIGLLRFDTFYARVHAPTLGTTLGAGCILLASMLYFSILQSRPVVHEILIAIFVTVTTPITLMLLVGAALGRDDHARAENEFMQPGEFELKSGVRHGHDDPQKDIVGDRSDGAL